MSIKHHIRRLEQKLAPGRTGALVLIDPTKEEIEEARRNNPCALVIFKNFNVDDAAEGAEDD